MNETMTMTYSAELQVVNCWCGIRHGVPEELANFQRCQHRDGKAVRGIYCPLGHSHVPAGEGRAAELERCLQSERQRHDQTKAALRDEEKKVAVEIAAKKRLVSRAENGVCIHCHRSFTNLRRHMASKHGDCKSK